MFRSFFPNPINFFVSAVAWTAVAMTIWFLPEANHWFESWLSLGPWLGIHPTEADPAPFFDSGKVWLYQFVVLSGYLFCVPWYFFNTNKRWFWWSVVGSVTILEVTYFNVQINAWLNDWYGGFYDLIQKALENPNTVTLDDYLGRMATVTLVLVPAILVLVVNLFLTQHYLFRWRRAMSFYYMANWQHVRKIEGASQRVQEDTKDFSSIMETLGINFIEAIMTLVVFLPILWELSKQVNIFPWIGQVDSGLVWLAIISAAFGTALLGIVGWRLPGLYFQNQRVEAAYRKELVLGEDNASRAAPPTIRELFRSMQKNYFRLYFHVLYFNLARYAYLQGAVFIPYVALGPSIVAGAITFGVFRQVLNVFDQVSDSFRFLVNSWGTIVNLISIFQRLRGFEAQIPKDGVFANDYDDPRYLATGENWPIAPPEAAQQPT
ncbi:MAG: peptide antibiotic transporter SbmA [Devosia sp.]